MKRYLFAVPLLLFILTLSGCWWNDNVTGGNSVNIAGTWRSTVTFTSCTPASVCSAAGFGGGSGEAIMVLTQSGNRVGGTYTYQGSGVVGTVSGTVAGSNVVIDGSASNLLGRVTVHLEGTVNQNVLPSHVSHVINLSDGRNGTVFGTGDFRR